MDGYVTIGTKLETNNFDSQIAYIEQQLQEIKFKLKQADMGFEVGDTAKLEAQYEKLSGQLVNLKTKQLELNKGDFSNVKKSIDKVGDSVGNVIKKVGRWVLAVFAIESAYGMLRRGMSVLSQYNDKIKDDVNYITYAMMSALQPVIEGLIRLAYKLLEYVSYIAKAWFGVNIFANASAKSMKTASERAKEIKKSLAGFDEMNILNNTNNSQAVTPSVDLSTWQGEVPSWIKWIADNKDLVINTLAGFATGVLAIGIGFKFLQGLGIGLILSGILILVQGIVDFLKDPSWNGFLTILQGISLVIAGIAIVMGGWITAIIALGVAIVTYVIQNWEKVKEIFNNFISWVWNTFYKPLIDLFDNLWNGFKDGAINAWNGIKSVFSTITSWVNKNIVTPVGNAISSLWDGIKSGLKIMLNGVITLINFLIDGLNSVLSPIRLLVVAIGKVMGKNWTMDSVKIPKISYLKTGAIINYPNKGVPVGNNLRGGEAGREGVIPLTNSQAMAQLGLEIGRNTQVNVVIPVIMDGKTIDRQTKRVRANEAFVMNG